jgi:hypothetical protein
MSGEVHQNQLLITTNFNYRLLNADLFRLNFCFYLLWQFYM